MYDFGLFWRLHNLVTQSLGVARSISEVRIFGRFQNLNKQSL